MAGNGSESVRRESATPPDQPGRAGEQNTCAEHGPAGEQNKARGQERSGGRTCTDDYAPASMSEVGALSLYSSLLRGELEGDEALRASRNVFELVLNSVHQAIWWKDTNSVFMGCNRKLAEYAGASDPSDLIGKTDADCAWGKAQVPRSGTTWFQDHDRKVMDSGKPLIGLRERVRIAGGRVIWVETNKVPLKDLDGTVVGTLGTFTDITDQVEAEAELQRTLEELDERVRERTSELSKANESLRREVEERVRLERQERAQLAHAEALRETAAAIARSLQLDDVIEQVLKGVERLCEHHRSYVAFYDNDGMLELAGERYPGREAHVDPVPHTRIPDPLANWAAAPASPDGSNGSASSAAAGGPEAPGPDPTGAQGGVRPVVLPLEVADQPLGCLVIEPKPDRLLTPAEVDRLSTLADQASSAISNSRSLVMARSLAAVEERQRLSNDLHDSVSQTLWTATLLAETLSRSPDLGDKHRRQAEKIHTLTAGALSEMRTLLLELRPSVIEQTPFADLMGQLVSATRSRKKARYRLQVDHRIEPLPNVKVALYRIVQESLNNVARHSEASEVEVAANTAGDGLSVSVSDDGVGFEVGSVAEHFGLRGMAERAAAVGACLKVVSQLGVGTTVKVDVGDIMGLPE